MTKNCAMVMDVFNGKNTGKSLETLDALFGEVESSFHPDTQNMVISLMHLLIHLSNKAEREGWSTEDIKKILSTARRVCGRSSFVRYTQEWPRGFAGDFKVINMIMDRQEEADQGCIGKVIGNNALCSPICQQHREKVKIQSNFIKGTCRNTKAPHIVSIACGASRDMEDARMEIRESGARVSLVDFDQDALDDSTLRLQSVKDHIYTTLVDLRRLPKIFKNLADRNGPFDLVYMGGLFDYFQAGIIKAIFRNFSSDLMQPGGRILFTNIARANPFRPWLEILADWYLIERNEKEMEELLALTPCRGKELYRDPTGLTWIAVASV